MPSKKGGSSSSSGVQDKHNIVINSARQAKANEASRNIYKHMSKVSSFLSNLEEYNPTVPEAVTLYYMNKAGTEVGDSRMVKLMSLAADHFLAKTVYESRQICMLRQENSSSGRSRKRKMQEIAGTTEDTFQEQDLDAALQAAGIRVRRSKVFPHPKK
jgi:transcription initiation factor TFIID subunit 10